MRGVGFVWDSDKDARNQRQHGIGFHDAAEAFFDPFVRVVDASRNDQLRDKLIGYLDDNRLIAVVNVEMEDDTWRIISAWPASPAERNHYDS